MRLRQAALAPLLCVLALTSSGPVRVHAGSEQTGQNVGQKDSQRPVSPVHRVEMPAGQSHDFRRMRLAGPFPAEVLTVVDGDTFEARVTVWLGHEVTTRVRLLGIDAAEMGSECSDERDMANVSRAALAHLLGRRVLLSDVRFDKYGGRVLARALNETGRDIAQSMLTDGYAIHYDGGRRQAWCEPAVTLWR